MDAASGERSNVLYRSYLPHQGSGPIQWSNRCALTWGDAPLILFLCKAFLLFSFLFFPFRVSRFVTIADGPSGGHSSGTRRPLCPIDIGTEKRLAATHYWIRYCGTDQSPPRARAVTDFDAEMRDSSFKMNPIGSSYFRKKSEINRLLRCK